MSEPAQGPRSGPLFQLWKMTAFYYTILFLSCRDLSGKNYSGGASGARGQSGGPDGSKWIFGVSAGFPYIFGGDCVIMSSRQSGYRADGPFSALRRNRGRTAKNREGKCGTMERDGKTTGIRTQSGQGGAGMRIYLSADIEGTCGIVDRLETHRKEAADYNPFARQMTLEVGAACRGALAAGAEEILVKDAHGSARNLDHSQLPRQAKLLRGWTGDPLEMMSGLDRGAFDAVFFTGYHAGAGCGGNPISHTMNGSNEWVTINGVRASEFLINAYTAGYYGVPVAFLSGDGDLCRFARTLIPEITAVAVNEGRGGGVTAIHPELAIERICAGAEQAARRAAQCQVPMPERFETAIRFRRHQDAYARHFYPGARLEDEKNVCFSSGDWYEVLRFFHFVLSD